jgi:hypothetical protein
MTIFQLVITGGECYAWRVSEYYPKPGFEFSTAVATRIPYLSRVRASLQGSFWSIVMTTVLKEMQFIERDSRQRPEDAIVRESHLSPLVKFEWFPSEDRAKFERDFVGSSSKTSKFQCSIGTLLARSSGTVIEGGRSTLTQVEGN